MDTATRRATQLYVDRRNRFHLLLVVRISLVYPQGHLKWQLPYRVFLIQLLMLGNAAFSLILAYILNRHKQEIPYYFQSIERHMKNHYIWCLWD